MFEFNGDNLPDEVGEHVGLVIAYRLAAYTEQQNTQTIDGLSSTVFVNRLLALLGDMFPLTPHDDVTPTDVSQATTPNVNRGNPHYRAPKNERATGHGATFTGRPH